MNQKVIISHPDAEAAIRFRQLVESQMSEAIAEVKQYAPNGPIQFLTSRHMDREKVIVMDSIPSRDGKRYIHRSHGPNRAARRAAKFRKKGR